MNARLRDMYSHVSVHATADREHEAVIELLLLVMVADRHISEDELDEIRHIVAEARRWLRPGGWLVLEIGSGHGPRVAELLHSAGLDDVAITADLSGHDRVAVARRGSGEAGSDLTQE